MQLPKSLSRLAAAAEGHRAAGWARSLPTLVSGLLVVLIAWQVVQLAWTLLGARGTTAPAAVTPGPATPIPRPAPAFDLPAIVNAHLFGVAAPKTAPGEGDPNAAPATQMPLVLVGTIAQSDPAAGLAIIGESAATAKVYAVGKAVAGGARLHAVYADRVILDRDGQLEALMLPKQYKGGGLTPAVAAAVAPPVDASVGERLRQLAAQAPGQLTDLIRPQPVFANGQQRGYRVYPGRNREQFTRLGLRPGDLVTAINGTPLDDPSRGMEIMQSINSASEVTVTVERNGQLAQVNINNAQLAAETAAGTGAPVVEPAIAPPQTGASQELE